MLDYTPITVDISIFEEYIQTTKYSLIKNSKEKHHFVDELINFIKGLKINSIQNITTLEEVVHSLTNNTNRIWYKYSKKVNITKDFKAWWNDNCHRNLDIYRKFKWLEDWKRFKRTVKKTKYDFFDEKINEIANKNCGL